MLSFLPNYFTTKFITCYLFVLGVLLLLFPSQALPVLWMIVGLITVLFFFYGANYLTKKWQRLSAEAFEKTIFQNAFIIRLIYVIISYFFYDFMTGQPFEFESADSVGYHEEAIWLLDLIANDQLDVYIAYIGSGYSDMGYVSYLALIYSIVGKNIIIVRVLKALLSAYTCVLVYRIAKRNFDESTGKIAGVLTVLFPNLIYYCGLHVKETEMVFLIVFFMERADFILKSKSIKPQVILVTVLLALSLFFFRTVLGATAVMAFVVAFVFSPTKSLGIGTKIGLGLVLLVLAVSLKGGAIFSEVEKYWDHKDTNQSKSLDHRAKGGNKLAAYGSAAVFAPVILLAPFPTMVNIETQQNHMLLHGAYFVRNVSAFFVFVSLLLMWKYKLYNKHLLILTFIFSYLAVLALSKFALVERFHMPVLCFIIILIAHGIVNIKNNQKKYFIPYLVLVSVIIIGWNAFKLAGRGML